MLAEILNVSVLYGGGEPNTAIPEMLEKLSRVKLMGQANQPQEVLESFRHVAPDLLLVYLDGEDSLPGWLEGLTSGLPQTSVMLCSKTTEPEFLIRAMQMGVREFLPLPLTADGLEGALERVRALRKRISDPGLARGKVVVVTGHKGGAGTTAIAVNLAIALAEKSPGKLALMDLGRPFPDIAHFLDQEASYNIFDLIENVADLDHTFLQKIIQPYDNKLAVLHGISDFHEQDSINLEALDKIFALLRGQYRWIIVDLSHWLDDIFLKVVGEADLVLLLTELTVPDLRNLGNLWPVLKQWRLVQDRIKLVINRYQRGSGLGLKNLDQVLKEPVFATLPSEYELLMESINRGVPLGKSMPNSKLWLGIQELAQKVAGHLEQQEEAVNGSRSRRRFWLF